MITVYHNSIVEDLQKLIQKLINCRMTFLKLKLKNKYSQLRYYLRKKTYVNNCVLNIFFNKKIIFI